MNRSIDRLLEEKIEGLARSKGVSRQDVSPRQGLTMLLSAWSHHWGEALETCIIKILVDRVF
nr:hypothetical protein [Candidatus Sigynarchaeum springense]